MTVVPGADDATPVGSLTARAYCSAPAAADLRVVGEGGESAAFEAASEADQECGPLGAAVMHELDGLPPVAVCEQQHCLFAAVFQVEGDRRADPFWGAADAAPCTRSFGESSATSMTALGAGSPKKKLSLPPTSGSPSALVQNSARPSFVESVS